MLAGERHAGHRRVLEEDDQWRFLRAAEKLDSVRDRATYLALLSSAVRVAARYREVPLRAEPASVPQAWCDEGELARDWPDTSSLTSLVARVYLTR